MASQVVLILCGLVGSGKSTFAQALELYHPEFVRANEDELGNRRNVEDLVWSALSQGKSVCVDRTNIDSSQRKIWVSLARYFPGTEVWCVTMDTPYEECEERLIERTGHPTITMPEVAINVLRRFAQAFQAPHPYEGFDRMGNLRPHPTLHYSKDDIDAILRDIRAGPHLRQMMGQLLTD